MIKASPAPVFTGFFIGSLLWRKALKLDGNYWAELAVGLLIWRVISMLPVLRIIAFFVAGPQALGVLTRMLGRKMSWKR